MTVLDRVPTQRIGEQARQVRFGRTMLTLLAGLLFGAGWLACRLFGVLWLVLAWCATAVRLGWVEARGPVRRDN